MMRSLENTLFGPHWKRIGIRHHQGINLPLSSAVSSKSCGIGEFFDLLPLIDWCDSLGINIIQLLPLNDSGEDPSPYNGLSSCALHPIYLSLHALPGIESHPDLVKSITSLRRFNTSSSILFAKVLSEKIDFLKIYFEKTKKTLLASKDFLSFLSQQSWVRPYALFKVLRKEHSDTCHLLWPAKYQNLTHQDIEILFAKNLEECLFHITIQYLCFLQLKTVKNHANEKGIFLKGDIPILISPDSVDAWLYPQLFDPRFSIGSPPDFYCKEGQYWGFPRPCWDTMRKDDFAWWKSRLIYAENFYDLYRIDHAVGLFRLWSIPVGHPSKEGSFFPKEEALWPSLGKEILEVFAKTSIMLPIAEDLGTVPDFVREILQKLGVCSTKVTRWEKNPLGEFSNPSSYIPSSMTCVSTHDSSLLGQWWEEESKEAKAYAKQQGWDYKTPIPMAYRKHMLKESTHSGSLFHINLLPEYLALIPELSRKNPIKERINIPGKILPSNWTYKFLKPLETILSHKGFFQEMQNVLQ